MTGDGKRSLFPDEQTMEAISAFAMPVETMKGHNRKERFVEKYELVLKGLFELSDELFELLAGYPAFFARQPGIEQKEVDDDPCFLPFDSLNHHTDPFHLIRSEPFKRAELTLSWSIEPI